MQAWRWGQMVRWRGEGALIGEEVSQLMNASLTQKGLGDYSPPQVGCSVERDCQSRAERDCQSRADSQSAVHGAAEFVAIDDECGGRVAVARYPRTDPYAAAGTLAAR
jgi:hypothetical protein